MLHLIPAPAHRVALRVAHAVRVRWWRLLRPRIGGCRAVVLDPAGRILLVRHTYGNRRWFLPGGGMGRREDPLATAVREVAEETGCRLVQPRLLEAFDEQLAGASNRMHIVAGRTLDMPLADNREIAEAAFFALDALPEMPPSYAARVRGWVTAAAAGAPACPDAAATLATSGPPAPTG